MTASSTPWGVRRALIAGLAALPVLAGGLASDAAGAKKKMRAAGIYVGQTNHFDERTVRFRLTPQGGIVDFVIPGVSMTCLVENPSVDPTFSLKSDTLTAPPMSIGPIPLRKQLPLGRTFHYEDPLPPPPPTFGPRPPLGSPPYRGIFVNARSKVLTAKPFYTGPLGRGFQGRANLATFSDTRGAFGTEECSAYTSLWDPGEFAGFEWFAVKQVKHKRSAIHG